jgi:hypothetical protein
VQDVALVTQQPHLRATSSECYHLS